MYLPQICFEKWQSGHRISLSGRLLMGRDTMSCPHGISRAEQPFFVFNFTDNNNSTKKKFYSISQIITKSRSNIQQSYNHHQPAPKSHKTNLL